MSKGKIEFDKSKILTAVTADQAKVGGIGWFGDSVAELRRAIESLKPTRLEFVANDDFCNRFVHKPSLHYALFFPAPYEFLQAKWVEENGLKVGDKVEVVRGWDIDEQGFDGLYITHFLGAGTVTAINVADILVQTEKWPASVPYFAIEKVKEPEYRPFASAEEFAPYRKDCWITRKEVAYQRMLVTEYNSSGIRVGKSYISYKELVKDYIFVDTGKPAGVKL